MKRGAVTVGYLVLGLLAAAGVALSAGFLVISTDIGRGLLVPRLLRLADDAIQGSIQLRSFHLLPGGGVELVGARVLDPDGEVVLRVERLRAYVDVARLRSKVIGVRGEIESPVLLLKRGADGRLSIARAFSPTRPSKPGGEPSAWSLRLRRLVLRGGSVRYVEPDGHVAFQADGISADARAITGPQRLGVELAARAAMIAPERAPISLDTAVGYRGTTLRVRLLRAAVGDTALDAVADLDWRTWRGRAAVLALAVEAARVEELAPRVPLAGDVRGSLYAEGDGSSATAGLELAPREGGGSARGALAIRLPPAAVAGGVDLHLDRLDLSRVLRGAPATALQLDLTGRGSGKTLADARGAFALSLAPSRIRAGRVGPVEVRATADRGVIQFTRVEATAPGLSLRGRGRWQERGDVAGQATVDASDLSVLRRNLEALLGRPLPPLSGAARVEAELSGTAAAPAVALKASAPGLVIARASVAELSLAGTLSGSVAVPRLQLEGAAARLEAGSVQARGVRLRARLEGRAGEVSLGADVPDLGPDPIALSVRGALTADGRVVELSELTLAWPGDRFTLQQPARVAWRGPSVDRLVLASGAQRIALSGGLSGVGRRRSLDAEARVVALDLGLLPRALLPPRLGLGGTLDATVTVTGTPDAPRANGQIRLADGRAFGLEGLSLTADGTYDRGSRRARLAATGRRAAGGQVEARLDVPVPFAGAPANAPVALELTARAVPVAEALRAARVTPARPIDGTASLEVRLTGTVGGPTLLARAALADARYGELLPLSLSAQLEASGAEARLSGTLDHQRSTVLELRASVPVRLGQLLRRPGPVLQEVADARLAATAIVPGLDLGALAGREGVPRGLRGRLVARADLTGSARAPRGTLEVSLTEGAYAGYRDIAAAAKATATASATSLQADVSMGGRQLARGSASIALALERLARTAERERAAVVARIDVPGADLARAGAPVPLAGELAGHVEIGGTLSALDGALEVTGRRVHVDGHPLGDVRLAARAGETLHAEVRLAVSSGGTLDGELDVDARLGLGALRGGQLGHAPARARVTTRDLDVAFLPALAPRLIRSASGKLVADVTAAGPLRRMTPKGKLSWTGGKIAVAELGEWSDIVVQASLSEDVLDVERIAARRGDGKLEAKARATGLAARESVPAPVTAELHTTGFTISRAGQDLARIDLDATLAGKLSARALEGELRIPGATVRLPNRIPRRIQSLEPREDIVIGSFDRKEEAPRAGIGPPAVPPFRVIIHLSAPGRFWVRSDNPRMNVELRADLNAQYEEALAVRGDVETVRGEIEPIGGRIFDLKRGRVHFTGGGPKEGTLEIQATYDNPQAKVTVAVTGTIEKPDVKLTSDPPMDESQIALLIATGRTELKAGGNAMSPGEEAGRAALTAVATQVFRDVLADKLPVDTVSLDASQLRAGKYITDKIYVGYTRRLTAATELGQNTNEVRVEYQITPRWTFQSRYGDAQSGGASLIWSKDY